MVRIEAPTVSLLRLRTASPTPNIEQIPLTHISYQKARGSEYPNTEVLGPKYLYL